MIFSGISLAGAITGSILSIVLVFTFFITFIVRKSRLNWKKNRFPPRSISNYGITEKYIHNKYMWNFIEEDWNKRLQCKRIIPKEEIFPEMKHQINYSKIEMVETRLKDHVKLILDGNIIEEVDLRRMIIGCPHLLTEAVQYYEPEVFLDLNLFRLKSESVRDYVLRLQRCCGLPRESCCKLITIYEKTRYGTDVCDEDGREFLSAFINIVRHLTKE